MTSSSIMDPADVFDADEIDNAIKIIENEIDAVKKQEIAEKQKDLPSQEVQNQEEKNSIDSLITTSYARLLFHVAKLAIIFRFDKQKAE